MKKSAKTILAASVLALSGAAGATATFSITVNPSAVGQVISDVLFGRPAPNCQRVVRVLPSGQRYWANTCDRVVYPQPTYVAPVYYTQPVYTQPVYSTPYSDSYYYNDGYYENGVTYSYPVRPAAPAIYQTPTKTTIINNDPYRW